MHSPSIRRTGHRKGTAVAGRTAALILGLIVVLAFPISNPTATARAAVRALVSPGVPGSIASAMVSASISSSARTPVNRSGTDPSWAGYVDLATGTNPARWNTSGNISEVSADWEEPNVTCPAASPAGYTQATWVGIDGFGNAARSVEQVGVLAVCTHSPAYKSPQFVPFAVFDPYQAVTVYGTGNTSYVHPADQIQAAVSYNASACVRHHCGVYTMKLVDVTNGYKLTVVGNPSTCDHPFQGSNYTACETGPDGSAECISEGGGYTADYGSLSFQNCVVDENGHTKGIGAFRPLYRINQNEGTFGSGLVVQVTSGFTKGTWKRANFTVTWKRYR